MCLMITKGTKLTFEQCLFTQQVKPETMICLANGIKYVDVTSTSCFLLDISLPVLQTSKKNFIFAIKWQKKVITSSCVYSIFLNRSRLQIETTSNLQKKAIRSRPQIETAQNSSICSAMVSHIPYFLQ